MNVFKKKGINENRLDVFKKKEIHGNRLDVFKREGDPWEQIGCF